MAKRLVKEKNWIPELEDEVKYYLSLVPKVELNKKEYERTVMPEFETDADRRVWELTEIDRCINGHDGLNGKTYFWFNYCWIREQRGKIQPQFRVADKMWFDTLEYAQNSHKYGVICVKRRRAGFSWKAAADVLHDASFNSFFNIGMNSMSEKDYVELFRKVKFIYNNLPQFLRATSTAHNTKMGMHFSYKEKDKLGNQLTKGTQSEVIVVAPTDSAYEGLMLQKWVSDECFSPELNVRMYNGELKRIDDINIGDEVMGDDSTKRTVFKTLRGVDEMYNVELKSGYTYTCNKNHKIKLYKGEESKLFTPEEYLALEKKKSRYWVHKFNGYKTKPIKFNIQPYLFGAWLGDGFSSASIICGEDKEVFSEIYKYAHKNNMAVSERTPKGYNNDFKILKINLKSYGRENGGRYIKNNFSEELRDLGVWGNKHIPKKYLNSSRKQRLQLLAGIIDTDGSKDKRKNRYEISLHNKRLSNDIYLLSKSLGFNTSIADKKTSMKRKDGTVYRCIDKRVSIHGDVWEIPVKIKRKKAKKILKTKGRRPQGKIGIRKITKAGEGEYVGLTLDGNNLFLDEFGVIHKNCGKVNNLNAMWSYTEPCLMQETKRMGCPVIFGCVTKGTKIWNNEGALVNVEDISKNDGVVGYNGVSASIGRVLHVNPPQKKECVRIKTNKGKTLECSVDHTILSNNKKKYWHCGSRKNKKIKDERIEFTNAEDINLGDRIGVIEEVNIFGNKTMFSPRLIGLLIGDGSYGFNNTPKLSNAEVEINNYIEETFDTSLDRSHTTKDGRLYKETRIKNICPIMRELGIYGQTKLKKTLPLDVHSYNKNDICELIGGLFDADGYVANMKNNKNVSISSASKSLLLEISMLLQKIGVHGGIYRIKKSKKNPRDKNDHFRLTISDKRSVLAFHKNVSFLTKRKQDNLNEIVDRFSKHRSEIGRYSKGKRYERVVFVERIGAMDVYNFGTNGTSTYVANGIITHNTAGEISREGKDFKRMWDQAEAYNLIRVFFAGWMGMDVDKYGNDQPEEIIRWIVYERYKKRDLDPKELNDFKQQYPLTEEEAFSLANTGGLGNIININRQVTNLRQNPAKKVRGRFRRDTEGKVVWKPSLIGECIIYEHPIDGMTDYALAGCDPADHDFVTEEASDMSTYIMTKHIGSRPPRIVFEYTDRPERANDYYDQTIMALEYYNNCKILIENNRYRMIGYFEDNGFKHLLKAPPQGVTQIMPTRQNAIGVRMSKAMKEYLEDLVEEYIEDHCEEIPSLDLLGEFIEYGSVNTDAVIAFGVTLINIKDDKISAKRRAGRKQSIPSFRLVNINGVTTRVLRK